MNFRSEMTPIEWKSRVLERFRNTLKFNKEEALEDFLTDFRIKFAEMPTEETMSIAFYTLESILKIVTPPDEELADSDILLVLWKEYIKLSATPEYLLYYLHENEYFKQTSTLHVLLAKHHMKKQEYILADEWIRSGESGFKNCSQIKLLSDDLERCAKAGLLKLVWNESQLYYKNNWNSDPGIPAEAFEQLFSSPIRAKKFELGLKPAGLPEKKKSQDQVKRLSDTCFVEFSADKPYNRYYIDRECREKCIGERTLMARELAYRLEQIRQGMLTVDSQAAAAISPIASQSQIDQVRNDDRKSKYAFWRLREFLESFRKITPKPQPKSNKKSWTKSKPRTHIQAAIERNSRSAHKLKPIDKYLTERKPSKSATMDKSGVKTSQKYRSDWKLTSAIRHRHYRDRICMTDNKVAKKR